MVRLGQVSGKKYIFMSKIFVNLILMKLFLCNNINNEYNPMLIIASCDAR